MIPAQVLAGLADVVAEVADVTHDMLWAALPRLATGGSSWTLQRPTTSGGGGVSGPATSEPAVTVRDVWVVRGKDIALTGTSTGTAVGDDDWTIHARATTNLRVGDRLTNQALPWFKVRIDTLQKTDGGEYWDGSVEVIR